MAYCLRCWNKVSGQKLKPKDICLSKRCQMCALCGECTRVIVCYRGKSFSHHLNEGLKNWRKRQK